MKNFPVSKNQWIVTVQALKCRASVKKVERGQKKGGTPEFSGAGDSRPETDGVKNTLLKMNIRLPKQMHRTE
ncbi:hypothetical protein ACSE3M_21060 [Bacillus velezensis]